MSCFLDRENGNLFMYSSFMPHDSGVRVSAPQSEFQDFCQAAICPFFYHYYHHHHHLPREGNSGLHVNEGSCVWLTRVTCHNKIQAKKSTTNQICTRTDHWTTPNKAQLKTSLRTWTLLMGGNHND